MRSPLVLTREIPDVKPRACARARARCPLQIGRSIASRISSRGTDALARAARLKDPFVQMGLYSPARSFARFLPPPPPVFAPASQPPRSRATSSNFSAALKGTPCTRTYTRTHARVYTRERALCDGRIEAWLFKAGKQADAVQRERARSPPRPGNCERRGALSVARFFDSDFPLSPFSFRCLFYLPACLSVATRGAGRFQPPRGCSSPRFSPRGLRRARRG